MLPRIEPHRKIPMTTTTDAIDQVLGIEAGSPLHALRALRPEFVSGAEACRDAVLHPEQTLDLPAELRSALARRVVAGADDEKLTASYPYPDDPALAALADGEMPESPSLAALARHADMIAAHPAKSGAEHLAALQEAGFTVPQIIALSELLAFACYQIRVVHGLRLLKEVRT